MSRLSAISVLLALACGTFLASGFAAAPKDPPPPIDLTGFRTVDKLVTTRITRARPGPVSLPGYLGINVKSDGKGLLAITLVQPASPAAKAGLKPGDLLARVDDRVLRSADDLREFLQARGPGGIVAISVLREQMPVDVMVTLEATSRPMTTSKGGPPSPSGGGDETLPIWYKDQYRLAVVVVDFPDVKHNDKIKAADWEEALFSRKTYQKTATGQPAHGSLNDYYREQSFGKFHIEGKTFGVISAGKKRSEYYQGAGGGPGTKTVLLTEALDKLTARDGKDALKDFDGLCFIYAGSTVQTSDRGSLYYPHRGSVTFQGKRWPYIICPEGGTAMESISIFAPVFGKLLGLPDLAARAENAGSEGLGVWCLMSNGAGQKGRPGHLSAWCKEQLGWLEPAVIDPALKQKNHPQAGGRLCQGMRQGAGSARRQRVLSAGEPHGGGLRRRPARSGAADLARGQQSARSGGSPWRGRADRPTRPSRCDSLSQQGQQRLHAVHDAVEPIGRRGRLACVFDQYPPAAGWADHLFCRLRVLLSLAVGPKVRRDGVSGTLDFRPPFNKKPDARRLNPGPTIWLPSNKAKVFHENADSLPGCSWFAAFSVIGPGWRRQGLGPGHVGLGRGPGQPGDADR